MGHWVLFHVLFHSSFFFSMPHLLLCSLHMVLENFSHSWFFPSLVLSFLGSFHSWFFPFLVLSLVLSRLSSILGTSIFCTKKQCFEPLCLGFIASSSSYVHSLFPSSRWNKSTNESYNSCLRETVCSSFFSCFLPFPYCFAFVFHCILPERKGQSWMCVEIQREQ